LDLVAPLLRRFVRELERRVLLAARRGADQHEAGEDDPDDDPHRSRYDCCSASASSRRSSAGRRNSTSSSTRLYGAMPSTPRVRNQLHTPVTSFSGADAPDVRPTTDTPSSQRSSISDSSSIRYDATPLACATSTRRLEFDELREPTTSSRSISPSISFTAHCRLEVA